MIYFLYFGNIQIIRWKVLDIRDESELIIITQSWTVFAQEDQLNFEISFIALQNIEKWRIASFMKKKTTLIRKFSKERSVTKKMCTVERIETWASKTIGNS